MNRHPALALAAVLLAVTAAIAQPPPDSVPADSTPAEETPPRPALYDPHNDVFSPSVARGLYAVSLIPQAYTWSALASGALDIDPFGARGIGAGLLITGGGIAGGLALTRPYKASLGSTVLSYKWGAGGIQNGFVLADLLYYWGQDGADDMRVPMFAGLLGGVGGNLLGYGFAHGRRLNGGNALMLGNAGTIGGAYGGLIAFTVLGPDAGYFPLSGIPWGRKATELSVLGGYVAGSWLWHRYAPRDWTTGDALSFGTARTLSILTGYTTAALLSLNDDYGSDEDLRGEFAAGLIVSGLGLTYSYLYHRKGDLALAPSLYPMVTSTMGGLVGGGLALVVFGDNSTEAALLIPMLAGAWAGFHLAPTLARAMAPKSPRSDLFRRVHICADPASAAVAYAAAKSGAPVRVPVLTVDF